MDVPGILSKDVDGVVSVLSTSQVTFLLVFLLHSFHTFVILFLHTLLTCLVTVKTSLFAIL